MNLPTLIVIAAFSAACIAVAIIFSAGSAHSKRNPSAGSQAPSVAAPHAAQGDLSDRVDELIRQGSKIMAIKLLREETSLGLAEAKKIVDSLKSGD